MTIQAPQLDINTVAAGGGSILSFRAGLFVVGPESAGAHPGPACYRKGRMLLHLTYMEGGNLYFTNADSLSDVESRIPKFAYFFLFMKIVMKFSFVRI